MTEGPSPPPAATGEQGFGLRRGDLRVLAGQILNQLPGRLLVRGRGVHQIPNGCTSAQWFGLTGCRVPPRTRCPAKPSTVRDRGPRGLSRRRPATWRPVPAGSPGDSSKPDRSRCPWARTSARVRGRTRRTCRLGFGADEEIPVLVEVIAGHGLSQATNHCQIWKPSYSTWDLSARTQNPAWSAVVSLAAS